MKWKIYVVGLASATVRRKFIKKQLKRLKITNYTLIDAISAAEMGDEWLNTQVNHKHLVRPLTGAEIACTLSHRQALEQFIRDRGVDHGVIIEDDALLPDDFVRVMESAIRYMKEDDVVMLAGQVQEPYDFVPVKKIGRRTILLEPVDPSTRIFTTAAYIITKPVAARHVKNIYPVTDVTDSWQYYKQKGSMQNIYLSYPFLVDQEIFQSSRDVWSLKDAIVNWIIYFKIPLLYSFFKERRSRTNNERLKNIHIVRQAIEHA